MPHPDITLDLWSDVVCPWCWIGKRRVEAAVAELGLQQRVQLRFHAFELGERTPASGEGVLEHLAAKYRISREAAKAMTQRVEDLGRPLGLSFDFAGSKRAPSFDAHRLVQAAQALGKGAAMMERLHLAHFSQGLDISDKAVLLALGLDAGLGREQVQGVLDSEVYADQVEADEQQAAAYGIGGVPFTVVQEKWAVNGAQGTEVFVQALQQALQA